MTFDLDTIEQHAAQASPIKLNKTYPDKHHKTYPDKTYPDSDNLLSVYPSLDASGIRYTKY